MGYDRHDYIADGNLQQQERLLLHLFDPLDSLVIFDVGACEGENAVRYGRLFPQAHVYAVEPVPGNFALLLRTAERYGAANVTPIDACLSDDEAEAELHVSSGTPPQFVDGNAEWDFGNKSSSLLSPGEVSSVHPWLEFRETIAVTTTRLDKLALRLGVTHVDFLHMDVQGAELKVMQGAGTLLMRTSAVWLEVEAVPLYVGQPLATELESFLRRHGFVRLLDTVRDASGDQFWCRASWLRARKGVAFVALAWLKQSPVLAKVIRRVGRLCSAGGRM